MGFVLRAVDNTDSRSGVLLLKLSLSQERVMMYLANFGFSGVPIDFQQRINHLSNLFGVAFSQNSIRTAEMIFYKRKFSFDCIVIHYFEQFKTGQIGTATSPEKPFLLINKEYEGAFLKFSALVNMQTA